MLPSFVIAGTMKGGTTALLRGVKAHPDVVIASGKEIHFFDAHFDRGVDWYRSQFPAAVGSSTVGEATPDYMYEEAVIDRMTSTIPDARIIVILRDPVARAYSHYWHNVRRGREPLTFEQALAAEPSSIDGSDPDRPKGHFAYMDRSRYIDQVRAIESRVGRSQMLVVANEDLRVHRTATLRSSWEFIGVDPERGDVTIPRRRIRWYVRERLSPARRARNAPYPPIDDAVLRRLRAETHDDVVALEAWWGRDLTSWRT